MRIPPQQWRCKCCDWEDDLWPFSRVTRRGLLIQQELVRRFLIIKILRKLETTLSYSKKPVSILVNNT
jgi:hypothetical protein